MGIIKASKLIYDYIRRDEDDHVEEVKRAIDDLTLDIKQGDFVAILGHNGSGKSTFAKQINGILLPTDGTVWISGMNTADDAHIWDIRKTAGMVFQNPDNQIIGNIVEEDVGFGPENLGVPTDEIWKRVDQSLEAVGMTAYRLKSPNKLSGGQKQRVAIAGVMAMRPQCIILDEPTAVLTPQEAERLFEILNNLKQDGKSLVFISHKLNEVMAISDRISVMRQGQYMGTVNKEETSPLDLTKRMIGREVFLNIDKAYSEAGDTILEVQDVWIPSQKETSKIRGMSLHVKAGEIVGVAGIDGNGQSELVEAITGLRKVEKGKILLCGKDITNQSPRKVRESGLSHIPEDRNTRGLNRAMTIEENLIAVRLDQPPFTKGIMMNKSGQDTYAKEMVEQFDIRPADYNLPTSSLSGGNAQKVVVAREVSLGNKLLVASQPTRGVDIGAIELIRNTLEKAKKAGAGVLLVSAELEEIISLSDRIVVIHEGKITGEMRADEANENNLGLLMMGGTDTGKDGEAAV